VLRGTLHCYYNQQKKKRGGKRSYYALRSRGGNRAGSKGRKIDSSEVSGLKSMSVQDGRGSPGPAGNQAERVKDTVEGNVSSSPGVLSLNFAFRKGGKGNLSMEKGNEKGHL